MKKLLIGVCMIILISSCSNFQRVLKGSDMEAKYTTGVMYYEKKDYYRALQLFEELINVYKGTAKAEQSYYYYTYCTYYVDDYTMAAYHFNSFINSYPNSKYAEEMQYMYAYCFYQDSPKSNLDQSNTIDAIEKFQLFINKYPSSKRVADANKLIDELRFKLETKTFNNAKLYYHTEEYKSAIAAFNNVLKEFPSTIYKEECLFLSLKSAYIYASNSIKEKQPVRYKDTIEQYYKLIDNFPQSKYLREAEKIYDDAQEAIAIESKAKVKH